jgi:flagellar basal body-associated protein FliL
MFDEVEHFFGKKNLKKLKHFAGKCSKFKKELNNQINKHLTPEDRVIVIGMTKNP